MHKPMVCSNISPADPVWIHRVDFELLEIKEVSEGESLVPSV